MEDRLRIGSMLLYAAVREKMGRMEADDGQSGLDSMRRRRSSGGSLRPHILLAEGLIY